MYTLNKGPSKIVSQTRRGLPQNFEKFESIRESCKKNGNFDLARPKGGHSNIPRPIFQKPKGETLALKHSTPKTLNENVVVTPHHEEIIQYISDSWNTLVAENCHASSSTTSSSSSLLASGKLMESNSSGESIIANTPSDSSLDFWTEPPSSELKDFKPFDLEAFWGQRLFQNITKNL